jgi:hypothetical protein
MKWIYMKTILIVILPIIGLFAVQRIPAQGTLYVSNLGQGPTGSTAIGSDSWIAQVFVTGTNSGGYALNSIQLLMNPASGNPTDFSVSIYSSLSPIYDLGSLSGSGPAAGGIFTYTASGITLSPSANYFVVLTAATPVAQGAYNWSAGIQYAFGSNQWEIAAAYFNSADGLIWTGHSRQNAFQFDIYATSVPEPATYALAGLGLVVLSSWRRNLKSPCNN